METVSSQTRPSESERLAALRAFQILDTPPDGTFDRIVALAAKLLRVPIAIVSLVDQDRIWFKAKHGLDVEQIDRAPGLCASAILSDEPYVLNDAKADARSLANPLVAGDFGLRFYAAVPLVTDEGHKLGTLCVIDHEPRDIGVDELAILQDLAGLVMDQMRLRLEVRRVADEVIEISQAREDQQDRLAQTEHRLAAVLENASVAIFVMDEHQHCSYMNAAAEQLTGYSLAETQGRALHDVVHHTHPDGSHFPIEDCPIDRAFPERKNMTGEEVFVHKDGSFYPVAYRASPIYDDFSKPVGTIIEVRDITEDKRAQEALKSSIEELASERQALAILNDTGARIAAELDLDKVVQLVVDAGVTLSGARYGAFFYNVLTDEGDRLLLYSLAGAELSDFDGFGMPRATEVFAPTFNAEGIVRSNDITQDLRYGNNGPHKGMPEGHLPVRSYLGVPVVSRSAEVLGGLFFGHPEAGIFDQRAERLTAGLAGQAAIAIDNARLFQASERAQVTLEQRVKERTDALTEANEALRQAQKMEAVGQLTGGIAHDFNNMLAVTLGSLDLLDRKLPEDARLRRYLEAAREGAQRAANLTQRLLAFSRKQPLSPEPIEGNRLVADMSELLRRSLGPSVKLETVLAAGLWPTFADRNQLENAILNLAVNARDAMDGKGRLTIETQCCYLDDQYAAKHLGLEPGQYVLIAVTDTGSGMDSSVIAKAFDPFFTTKDVGRGTGLGLSQVYGFVKQSGGHVAIYSEKGVGTTVKLYLPRLVSGEAPIETRPRILTNPPLGDESEVILVVDDEEAVRSFTVEALEELGYSVVEAQHAIEALELLKQRPEITLLLTDIVMPEMTGRELADKALELRPDLRVLYTTGYTRNAVVHNGVMEPNILLLGKPFTIEQLAAKVRSILER